MKRIILLKSNGNTKALSKYKMINIRHICNNAIFLRAKLLVACLVTPALWLNLSDSRNIFIIHFGQLLKERTLDSIGHDLWKKYNVVCLLWMIRYISLLTNIFTQWILVDA